MKRSIVLIASAIALLFCLTFFAAQSFAGKEIIRMVGEITAIDLMHKTVVVQVPIGKTVYKEKRFTVGGPLAPDAELIKDSRSVKLEEFKVGDREKQLQFHTGTPETAGRTDRRAAMFHGHGAGTDDTKDRILRSFRRIDSGVQGVLSEENAPVVLAGVDYLLALYRKANSYPGLCKGGIAGNPEGFSAKELHEQAWKIVEPHFHEVVHDAAARYRQLAGTARAADDLRVILPASHHGRVELLFVAVSIQKWGVFDPLSSSVTMHERWEPGDEDLLNLAALQTMRNGGAVYAAELDEVPDTSYSAALFRY